MAPPTPSQPRKANLKTICSECKQLQDRLNAATAVLTEIVNKKPETPETLQDFYEANDERDQVLRDFVEHLKTHTRETAA